MPGERRRALKILLLSNKVPYPANDGSSIAIKMMIDGLLANDAEVSLLSLNTLKHYKSAAAIAAEQPQKLHFEAVTANTNIHPSGALINLLNGQPYHVSRFSTKAFEKVLIEKLQAHTFDLIQVEGLAMMVYLDTLKKYSRAPISLRAHNVEYLIWERHLQGLSDYFRKQYLQIQVNRLRKFEESMVRQVDFIVPITPVDEEELLQLNPQAHSMVIPCGINPEELKPQAVEPDYDVTYLASFDWPPNVQGVEWFLEKVWPIIIRKRPATTFALGGRDLPASIANRHLTGVTVVGPVQSMPDFISRGRVVAIPLLAGSGMRIKIVENMALGKAMVSTPVGAEGIELKDSANILLADNPAAFAQNIIDLLENPEKRQSVATAARSNVEEHYNTFRLGRQLLDFYQKYL